MPEIPETLKPQIKRLNAELDRRCTRHDKLEPYLEGEAPMPAAITEGRLTKLYRYLMPVAEAPWGSLIVDSKLDRLEVAGIRDADKEAAKKVWDEAWQTNAMDAESKLGHGAALLDGRFYASVWPNDDGTPDISLDDCTQMVVEYEPGNRRKRVAALRRWKDGDRVEATLWRPEGLYKLQGPENGTTAGEIDWEPRVVKGEDWPLPNEKALIPVELRVNGRLKPGRFPFARGEFEHCVGLVDRIHLLTFLGLVVAFWMGFPLTGVTGEKIRRRVLTDDDGNPLLDDDGKEKTEQVAPFERRPDSVAQFENPNAKVWQLDAADRTNLSIFAELEQLSVITKTPRHYFPMANGMANLSAEAIMASEGSMHAAVSSHKASLGEGWEEVLRDCGKILGVDISQQAELEWLNREARSLAEQADAFVKLATNLPWMAAAEFALNTSQEQIQRWQTEAGASPILKLIADAQSGAPAN